jgi:hypothetical protein
LKDAGHEGSRRKHPVVFEHPPILVEKKMSKISSKPIPSPETLPSQSMSFIIKKTGISSGQ